MLTELLFILNLSHKICAHSETVGVLNQGRLG